MACHTDDLSNRSGIDRSHFSDLLGEVGDLNSTFSAFSLCALDPLLADLFTWLSQVSYPDSRSLLVLQPEARAIAVHGPHPERRANVSVRDLSVNVQPGL